MSQLSLKNSARRIAEGLDSLTFPSAKCVTAKVAPKIVATHSGVSDTSVTLGNLPQDTQNRRGDKVKDPVRLYLDDVRRIAVLEPKEQTRLFFVLDRHRKVYEQSLLAFPRVCSRLEEYAEQLYLSKSDLRGEIDLSQFKKHEDSQSKVKRTTQEKLQINIQRWRIQAEKSLDALKKLPVRGSNTEEWHVNSSIRDIRARLISELAFSRSRLEHEERRVLRLATRFCAAFEALNKGIEGKSQEHNAERVNLRMRVNLYSRLLGVPSVEVGPLLLNLKSARNELQLLEQTLTDCNKPLVVSIAKSLCKKKQNFLDMIQDGNAGLMLAVQKFRPQLGWKFSTYASNWIKQGIKLKIRSTDGAVRESEGSYRNAGIIRDAAIKFSHRHGHAPSAEQLFEQSGLTEERFRLSTNAPRQMLSLDRSCSQDSDGTQLAELIPDRSENLVQRVLENEQATLLKTRLVAVFTQKLNEREQLILKLRYGMGQGDDREWTLEEVGKLLKITRERVRQLQAKAERKLSYDQGLEGLVS